MKTKTNLSRKKFLGSLGLAGIGLALMKPLGQRSFYTGQLRFRNRPLAGGIRRSATLRKTVSGLSPGALKVPVSV